jgi:hypothetical protein
MSDSSTTRYGAGDTLMFWALVGIGFAGAIMSTVGKVHAIGVTSAFLALVAPIVLMLTDHSVSTTLAFTLGAVTILQACYLGGLFCVTRFRSPSIQHDHLPQSTR